MPSSQNLEDAIDDAIDAWHQSGGSLSLHDWLGLTLSEYARFVEHPELLKEIFQERP